MAAALPLRAALTRGALVTLANWPVILIEFAIEALYKLALAVPIVGGSLMVTMLVGGSARTILSGGVRSAAAVILSALMSAPVALASFVAALALVGVAGSLFMFTLKGGTLAILVGGERRLADVERATLRFEVLLRASAFDLRALLDGVRRLGRRMAVLSLWLSGAYVLVFVGYVIALAEAFRLADRPGLGSAWPLVVAVATAAGVVALAVVNVVFDLMRIIVVCDDCGVRPAASRLAAFLVQDVRQVVGIFAVVSGLLAFAAAASLLVAAGLALVAWIPVVGLIVVPLQLAAWLVRGLLFQFMGLAALAAYQTQYRRFAEEGARPIR